jgi:hypothetical protein
VGEWANSYGGLSTMKFWNEVKEILDDFFYDRQMWLAAVLVIVLLELSMHYPYN